MDLLLHPDTKKHLDEFLTKSTQSIIIEGHEGVGKTALANYLSSKLLYISEDNLASYPYYLFLQPTDNTISIDNIRSCTQFIRLKTLGKNNIRRVLLIENAQNMTIEAQNAFLKLFEEPPEDTVIILTVTNTQKLLPTIQSRAQTINVKIPTFLDTKEYFSKLNYNDEAILKAQNISEGRVGLMAAILKDNTEHPLLNKINEAKDILKDGFFDRMKRVDVLSKQKSEIPSLLQALALVCKAAMHQSSDNDNTPGVKRWLHSLKTIAKAENMLPHNPNMKLLLSDLLLNL